MEALLQAHPVMTLLAQLSDPHILEAGRRLAGGIDTAALLRQAIAALPRWAPDALLISGDLTESGRWEQYLHLGRILAEAPCPVWLIPGNHDDRETLTRWLAEAPAPVQRGPAGPWLHRRVDVGPLRLLLLDSLCTGHPHGELCGERLQWLARELQLCPGPTLLALHHPPYASGIAEMDAMALQAGALELEALLRRHPQVERLLCGHLHRSTQCRFGGTLAMSAPSCAHQLELDLDADAELAIVMEPPGLLLHRWDGRRLVSHLQPIGAFASVQAPIKT